MEFVTKCTIFLKYLREILAFFYGESINPNSLGDITNFEKNLNSEEEFASMLQKLSINEATSYPKKLHTLKKEIEIDPETNKDIKNDNQTNNNPNKVRVNFGENSAKQVKKIFKIIMNKLQYKKLKIVWGTLWVLKINKI